VNVSFLGAAVAAVAVAPLIAFNVAPSATFFNQATAIVGWAAWLLVLAASCAGASRRVDRGLAAAATALGLLALAALLGIGLTDLPGSLALSAAGLVLTALLAVGVGGAMAGEGRFDEVFAALCIGLLVAGLASAAIGLIQVFAPQWADGTWIAASANPGVAIGNLRQPNHLSTLLLWSIVAAVWLGESGRLRRAWAWAAALLMLFVVVLTASRTGLAGALLLALWGVLDRRLAGRTRLLLIALPALYGLFWLGMSAWSHLAHQAFAGEAKLSGARAAGDSRWKIYADTLALIRTVPWTGVGFGEFNFAWSLTPFPNRHTAFFDHTHNLPLQLAVELGLPLATLICALLLYAMWRAWVLARRETGHAPPARAANVIVWMAALHSLLEYPLWYAYFLLPTAFAFGLALGTPQAGPAPRGAGPWRAAMVASLVMMLAGAASLVDYSRVVAIFTPGDDALPLAQRIAAGRRSVLFAHHADYAAATTAERPSEVMDSFKVASHYLLDTRLMMAWANAYAELGDLDRARHIAARLREFRNPDAKDYFAPCEEKLEPVPYQCEPPSRAMDWRDFR
jgi:O-antigen ligase